MESSNGVGFYLFLESFSLFLLYFGFSCQEQKLQDFRSDQFQKKKIISHCESYTLLYMSVVAF